MENNSKLFKFNLIPPKSKEEIVIIQERDNSILYSFILIFFAVLIFFILSIIQTVFIKPRINKLKSDLSKQDSQIASFDTIRATNGELFVKAQALGPILETDFEAIKFLDTTSKIVASDPNSKIISYGRESTGKFALTIVTSNYDTAAKIIEEGNAVSGIEDIFLRQVSKEENTVRLTISFTVNNV